MISVTVTPRKLIDPNLVPNPYGSRFVNPVGSVRLSLRRGCGMKCKFCNWGGGFSKPLSEENIKAIMEYAFSRNMGIWIVDSAINRRKQDLSILAKAVRELTCIGLKPEFTGFFDALSVDAETCTLAKECGFTIMEVGLQTLTTEVLVLNNRKFDKRSFEEKIALLKGVGEVIVDIMLGLPGDNPEGFVKTVDYLKSLEVQVHLFHLLGEGSRVLNIT